MLTPTSSVTDAAARVVPFASLARTRGFVTLPRSQQPWLLGAITHRKHLEAQPDAVALDISRSIELVSTHGARVTIDVPALLVRRRLVTIALRSGGGEIKTGELTENSRF